MACFHNVLAGVDIHRDSDHAGLDPVGETTVRRATWVARQYGARLVFFTAEENGQTESTPGARAPHARLLAGLVGQARTAGVDAEALVGPTTGWLEIIRRVVRDHDDLVVIGRSGQLEAGHAPLRATAKKLLRECPCPVWVTRPGARTGLRSVLVASDADVLGERALRLAVALAGPVGASVHLLHVTEYPLDRHWSTGLPDPATEHYHRNVRAEIELQLRAQIARAGGREVRINLIDGTGLPDDAIVKFVGEHETDLLVVGTVSRTGLAGWLLGNAAERILPEVNCDLLVIKPSRTPNPTCPG
jgi:nucleotide-binding universal stress UspA family protein